MGAIASGAATETQRLGIPAIVAHERVALVAPTGSGKTLVAGVSACIELATGASSPKRPRVLVLCPTRELADQVSGVLADVLQGVGARAISLTGSPSARRDTYQLARPVDCLVATPGRMLDLIRRGTLTLDDVGHLVLDEADMLLGISFEKQTAAILKAVTPPAGRPLKVLAMTATGSADYLKSLESAFAAPFETVTIDVPSLATGRAPDSLSAVAGPTGAPAGPPASLEVLHVRTDASIREAIVDMCARAASAMVFVPRRSDVADVLADLRSSGIEASGFTGRSATSVRNAAMESLRSGEVSALVSTDVTARGIDVADLSLVVHVGLPHSAEDLTHRSGRTGRGHRPPGLVVAVIAPDEDARLREFAEAARMRVRLARNSREVTEKLGTSDVSKRVVRREDTRTQSRASARATGAARGRRSDADSRGGPRRKPRGGSQRRGR